jgi:large subunit ribosomal protein L15
MELHTLKPAKNAVKKPKVIIGQGTGKGRTAAKGTKGAQSRSGYKTKPGFEGGQMPLQRRLPIVGFKNPNRITYKPINLDVLQRLADTKNVTEITPAVLHANGLLSTKGKCKILGDGAITTKFKVQAHAFSASAKAAIEKMGGEAHIL